MLNDMGTRILIIFINYLLLSIYIFFYTYMYFINLKTHLLPMSKVETVCMK